jgi:hypothetical protein
MHERGVGGGEGFAIDASVVKADAARAGGIPGIAMNHQALGPAQASRAVREYLEGIEAEGRPETMRKNISITDPAAEWTCAPGGPAFFAYSTNYLVDVRAGVIVDVEATSAHRIKEVDARRTMIDRDAALQAIAQRSKEGRDAVCPPQADYEARPIAIAGAQRCSR